MTSIWQLKVEGTLQECAAHLKYLSGSAERLAQVFPLSSATLETLNDETVTVLDQFVYRFTKLQDALGTRLFPALINLIRDDGEIRPFVDILNQLEKLGIVKSVEGWQVLRTLRNNHAHEYPDSLGQRGVTLNALFIQWIQLADMFHAAKEYYDNTLRPLYSDPQTRLS